MISDGACGVGGRGMGDGATVLISRSDMASAQLVDRGRKISIADGMGHRSTEDPIGS